ncbi:putative aminohydrolase SsnA [Clostridium omnivorum]|uniref:Chlorohydrolase n=1 Tax=Clostridium omnivorum TaxID=1604902 RepID=A0ABQ5N110_9CLOT|nr:putative aminohydrolase SsnA [Clostridium sp. E14]GLC28765.1 chlorohydrolase [Clostridium sp. E14]
MYDLVIVNANIVVFDDNFSLIENGFLVINQGNIQDVGYMTDYKDEFFEANEKYNANGKLIMPGFICTHTHIYSAFARGMDLKGNSPKNFKEILEQLWWRLDKKLTLEDIYYSALVTIIESIKNGVTCIFDHHASPNCVEKSLDIIEKAFDFTGMRGVLCYEVSDRDGKEIALKGIAENSRFISKCRSRNDDMIKGLFGLHAAFTLSNETLKLASVEGNRLKSGFHIHAAEGVEDLNYCAQKYNCGVVERLNSFNILNSNSILAHCIHIKHEEKKFLKKCVTVHNPESNMNNAVGFCDALDLTKDGVMVGLGSDGFSHNPFRAMEVCYVLHKHEKKDPRVMGPKAVIDLGIVNNCKIASRYFNNELGVIKKGAKADLIIVDYNSPTPLTKDNICGHIVFGINSNIITHTIINGKIVMRDRVIDGMDEEEVFAKSRVLAKELWRRF